MLNLVEMLCIGGGMTCFGVLAGMWLHARLSKPLEQATKKYIDTINECVASNGRVVRAANELVKAQETLITAQKSVIYAQNAVISNFNTNTEI